jgi:hypothetical protein
MGVSENLHTGVIIWNNTLHTSMVFHVNSHTGELVLEPNVFISIAIKFWHDLNMVKD